MIGYRHGSVAPSVDAVAARRADRDLRPDVGVADLGTAGVAQRADRDHAGAVGGRADGQTGAVAGRGDDRRALREHFADHGRIVAVAGAAAAQAQVDHRGLVGVSRHAEGDRARQPSASPPGCRSRSRHTCPARATAARARCGRRRPCADAVVGGRADDARRLGCRATNCFPRCSFLKAAFGVGLGREVPALSFPGGRDPVDPGRGPSPSLAAGTSAMKSAREQQLAGEVGMIETHAGVEHGDDHASTCRASGPTRLGVDRRHERRVFYHWPTAGPGWPAGARIGADRWAPRRAGAADRRRPIRPRRPRRRAGDELLLDTRGQRTPGSAATRGRRPAAIPRRLAGGSRSAPSWAAAAWTAGCPRALRRRRAPSL